MKLCDMTCDDLLACADVFARTFNAPPWNERWTITLAAARLAEIMHAPGFLGVVAWDDEESIGFAAGVRTTWWRGQRYNLKEMCVLPGRQRHGVGRELMRALLAQLSAAGVGGLHLMTARGGPAAAFYTNLGFQVRDAMVMLTRRC